MYRLPVLTYLERIPYLSASRRKFISTSSSIPKLLELTYLGTASKSRWPIRWRVSPRLKCVGPFTFPSNSEEERVICLAMQHVGPVLEGLVGLTHNFQLWTSLVRRTLSTFGRARRECHFDSPVTHNTTSPLTKNICKRFLIWSPHIPSHLCGTIALWLSFGMKMG